MKQYIFTKLKEKDLKEMEMNMTFLNQNNLIMHSDNLKKMKIVYVKRKGSLMVFKFVRGRED